MIQPFLHKSSDLLNKFSTGDGLQKKVALGSIWLGGANGVEQVLRLLRNMILARLLAPEAFGIMATVMSAVIVAEAFSEVGLTQSVIQNKKGSDQRFLNIIWWLASLRGILLYATAFFAAPLISHIIKCINKPQTSCPAKGFKVCKLDPCYAGGWYFGGYIYNHTCFLYPKCLGLGVWIYSRSFIPTASIFYFLSI